MTLCQFIKAFKNIEDFAVTIYPNGAPMEFIWDSDFFKDIETYECSESVVTSFTVEASEVHIYCD